MLYTHNGSLPSPIQFRITLSDGRTRTDPATFTPEEIADAGYVAADPKPMPGADQVVSWGGSGWVVRAKTSEELAEEAAAQQAADMAAGKAECARRIMSVADLVTQTNLTANYAAGNLTTEQEAVYMAGLQWIRDMQAAWPALVTAGSDLSDDANWPAVPAGAVELAEAF
jgi:quinolinate synthase